LHNVFFHEERITGQLPVDCLTPYALHPILGLTVQKVLADTLTGAVANGEDTLPGDWRQHADGQGRIDLDVIAEGSG